MSSSFRVNRIISGKYNFLDKLRLIIINKDSPWPSLSLIFCQLLLQRCEFPLNDNKENNFVVAYYNNS